VQAEAVRAENMFARQYFDTLIDIIQQDGAILYKISFRWEQWQEAHVVGIDCVAAAPHFKDKK
jgi:hypothetical protein